MEIVLQERVAVVTGASRGIGATIALELAHRGCLVFGLSRSGEISDEIAGNGVIPMKCDVSNKRKVDDVLKDIKADVKEREEYENINILVNCAGVTSDGLFFKMSEEQWDDVISVNLTGTKNMCQVFGRQIARSGYGRIVNISSIVGIMGHAYQANYAASKGGVIALTKTLARELGEKGVTVNAVCPGLVETDMTAQLNDVIKKEYRDQQALKGYEVTDQDVADMVVYLVSIMGKSITGQAICVDGGTVI